MIWDGKERREDRRDEAKVIEETVMRILYHLREEGVVFHPKECPCDNDEHRVDHEAVQSLIKVAGKIEDIKWGVLKAVAIAGVFALLAVLGLKIKGGG